MGGESPRNKVVNSMANVVGIMTNKPIRIIRGKDVVKWLRKS